MRISPSRHGRRRHDVASLRPAIRAFGRAAVSAIVLLCADPASADRIELGLPLACTFGVDCVVQNFVDVDPSPGFKDYRCQSRGYDGHKGTDFRVPDLEAMRRGVPVLAVAPGKVLRVRDGMADRFPKGRDDPAIAKRDCGNGVVIEHADGWTTQYCHLKRGSIRVRGGDIVQRATTIGQVGLSGRTAFPHVHLSVKKDGRDIDPMTGAAGLACGSKGRALFSKPLAEAIAAQGTHILNAGFSEAPVTMRGIERGMPRLSIANDETQALVFYFRTIWVRSGDRFRIDILDSKGGTFVKRISTPIDRDKAQYMIFSGKKRPETGWPKGLYKARGQVLRGGKPVAEAVRTILVR